MARLLGIDPGTVRCGVAITDSLNTMAFARPALLAGDALLESLRALIEDEDVSVVVVGRPLSLAGTPTESTRVADALFEELRASLDRREVVQWDERLTTVSARKSLHEAGKREKEQRLHVDSAAAVILLESYLAARRAR